MQGYLVGSLESGYSITNIDMWRAGLKQFVAKNWNVLQPQLTCPIRDDIDACKGCLDTQVIACVVEQKSNEEEIAMLGNNALAEGG